MAFLVFVIRQAITSPNVTQRIEEPAAQVDVPDVRFCFDGFPNYGEMDSRSPGVICQTDIGYSCTQFVKPLNMSIFTPTFASQLGAVNCYLFRSDESFKMTSTSGANNGSRLLFTFFGDQSISYGRVHVSLYPKAMDPNVKVYNVNDDIPVIMSDFDVLTWQNNERNDIQTTNIFEIEPYSYNALSYKLIDHRYLQSVGWNYVASHLLPILRQRLKAISVLKRPTQITPKHMPILLLWLFILKHTPTLQIEKSKCILYLMLLALLVVYLVYL